MTVEIAVVLGLALIAIILFATEKLRIDVIALLVLGTLAVTGLISTEQAISGFSNPATVTVAAMFVLAAGLQNSGALSKIGDVLGKSNSPFQFLLLLFITLGIIAPFVNNTAVVAVFIPIVMTACAKIGMSASKALIPLSYVSQMAGVCTLVGTSTNLIVNAIARESGHPGFSMFEFTPLGLIFFAVGGVYLLTVGRWLLPNTRSNELVEQYELGKYITELRVMEDSTLIGQSAGNAKLGEEFGVFVLELIRNNTKLPNPRSQTLEANDILLARGDWSQLDELQKQTGLEVDPKFKLEQSAFEQGEQTLSEIMIAPRSRLDGRTVGYLKNSWNRQAVVLGIHRRGQVLRDTLDTVRLQVGDVLLILTPTAEVPELRGDSQIIVLSERAAEKDSSWRAPFALLTMALVIALPALNWVPISITALLGAVAMTLAGCLRANDVYESIDWRIIILLAGLLPLGIAMSETGAAQFLVENTVGFVKPYGALAVLATIYLMALILTEFMSNAATAVLLTPIGLSTATMLDANPTPFLIAITFAASTSFATPVGYQTNTMVYAAGGYKFTDFLKVGLPLNLIYWVLGVVFIPMFWPL